MKRPARLLLWANPRLGRRRDAAADGAPVANRTVRDAARDERHQPARYIGDLAILDLGMRNACTNRQNITLDASLAKFG